MQLDTITPPTLDIPRNREAASSIDLTTAAAGRVAPVAPRPEVPQDACVRLAPRPVVPLSPSFPHPLPNPQSAIRNPQSESPQSAIPPSPDSLRIRSQRLALVRAVDAHVAQEHCSIAAACQHLNISQATYSRHAAALASGGEDALLPGYDRCGRHSTLDILCPTEDRAWLRTQLQRLNGKTHHAQTAASIIARDPACPSALAAYLRATPRIPKSILREANLTSEMRAKFNGPRDYKYNSSVNLRDMTEILPDGTRVPIQPGDWWEFDDMSVNTPFWFEVPADCQDRAATVDGIALGRQGLYAIDLASGKWLGHLLIGRPRDAYRCEDILRFYKLLFSSHGKPRRGIRLELGSWKARAITGYKLSATGQWVAEQITVPATTPEQLETIVAGIRNLGIEVSYCYTSHQKGMIESSFRHLQDLMAASEFANIGRHRGEGESATAGLLRAKAGRCHPRAAGFAYIEQASDTITTAETLANGKHKHGRLVRGIPDERWLASITLSPLAPLTPADHAVFFPERSELQIRGGHITPTRDNTPFPYIAPELFARLGNGYRLLCAFDPSEPQLGCALWNNETSSANTDAWPLGQFLGFAQYEPLSPQFGRNPDTTARDNRKTAANFHRTAYAALVPGRQTPTVSTLRDGKGNTVSITRGPSIPNRKPAPRVLPSVPSVPSVAPEDPIEIETLTSIRPTSPLRPITPDTEIEHLYL